MTHIGFLVVALLAQNPPVPAAAPKPPSELRPYETMLGKFGSRIAIDPKPQFGRMAFSPMGRFDDRTLEMTIGIRYGGVTRVLPFTSRTEAFESIEQKITPTRLIYTCTSPRFPFGVRFTWIAPFCPRDEKLTTAPFLYLDVEMDNPSRLIYDAEVVVSLPIADKDEPQAWDAFHGVSLSRVDAERRTFQGWALLGDGETHVEGAMLTVPIHAGRFATGVRHLALVGWVGDAVLDVHGTPHRFLYTKFFDGPDAVVAYARDERKRILERTALFDSTVLDTGLPEPLKNLLSFAFQSFAPNVWWCVDDKGNEWFSVWEGYCRFHSTVDVEYNDAVFYLQYWPELLGKLLDEWATFGRDGILAHDMGGGTDVAASHTLGAPGYDHEMEVEENANYLLLLDAYWRATADAERVRRLLPFAWTLARNLLETDEDGDGFPDRGTGNTLDDASEAVQFGNGQTYLGVKTLAAFRSLRDVMALEPDRALERRLVSAEIRIARTLRDDAWIGDHFAVCLDRERGRTRNAWTGRLLPPGELRGWDGTSIVAPNGILFPMRSGLALPIDRLRLKTDLTTALGRTMRPFGCAHSDSDDSGWISQNLWRDMIAAYLGVDLAGNAERYWKFELERNRDGTVADWGGFCDSPTNRWLSYYPRGVTAFGLVPALAGLSIDAPAGVLRYAPVRADFAVPLTAFADWEKGEVPWLRVRRAEGADSFVISINHRDRLGAMRAVDATFEREDGVRIQLATGVRTCRGDRSIVSVESRGDGSHVVRLSSFDSNPFFLAIGPLSAAHYVVFVDGKRWNDFTRDDLSRGVLVPGARATATPPSTLSAAQALTARLDGIAGAEPVRAAVDALWDADERDRPMTYEVVPDGVAPVIRPREPAIDLTDHRLERAIADALSQSHGSRALAPLDIHFDVAPRAGGEQLARLRVRNDLVSRATVSVLLAADPGLVAQAAAVTSFELARGERHEWTVPFGTTGFGSLLESKIVATVSIEGARVGAFGSFEESAIAGDGLVRTWLVAGPFEAAGGDALNVAHPPEEDPRPDVSDAPGGSAWKDATAIDGLVDFRASLGSGDATVSYAHTWVWCADTRNVQFSIGSDDGVKLFVDGRDVHCHREERPAKPDQDLVEVALDAGWHRVLAKVENVSGRTGLYLRVRGGAGLRASARAPETSPAQLKDR
ncbi:MAG: DUF4965 domain-containing protein [Planctomycetes bacterium]|nr:DUF4965 domain-containing protein [Planctomycetota bacterium]